MVKSIYLNYSNSQGNLPYKFVVPLDETLKLTKNSEVALHNVELERPIISLDNDQSFYIYLNPYGGISQSGNDFTVEDTPENRANGTYKKVSDYTLTPNQVLDFETEIDQKKTFQINSFYRNLLPNIYITIPRGIYSKNGFLESIAFQANKQILEFFTSNLIQFYNPYRFAVVNDGDKTFLGLYNESKLVPGRISSVPNTVIPDIVNSNNMSDDGLSSIKIADFTTIPSNLAYPSAERYLINTERSIYLDGNSDGNYTSFCFLNSSVNILNNKQDSLTDRQNSGLQFTLNFSEAGQDEYYAGFLSQCYQMRHWPDKNVPQLIEIKGLDGIELPTSYCGLYFRKEADGVFMHVVGVSNPYYAVDTFEEPDLDAERYLCYRNSTTPIEYMNCLYSTFIPTSTQVKEKGVYGIEFYYRYSKQNKSLVYQNAAEESFIPENVRIYFRVFCSNGIDSKTNNRVLFDSRTIDYYFSHEMLKENYLVFNPESMQSAVFDDNDIIKRDALANMGVAGGFVPFLACANVAETGSEGFYNLYFNATRLYDYQQARTIPTIPQTVNNWLETGYFTADPDVEVQILGKYDYLPLGIYSYGFANMSEQMSKILGGSITAQISPDTAIDKAGYNGFTPSRYPSNVNAELGIYTLFTEGNKYHVILKNVPLAAMANVKDTSSARRQNIVYTVRQSDLNITNVETNSLTITHYPHLLKYLSLYNNNEIQLNSIEVEIRNADTGRYAEEITDCSLEILFNQN
jgi:hypothetical protein